MQEGRILRTMGCLSAAKEIANRFFRDQKNADCGQGEPCLHAAAAFVCKHSPIEVGCVLLVTMTFV